MGNPRCSLDQNSLTIVRTTLLYVIAHLFRDVIAHLFRVSCRRIIDTRQNQGLLYSLCRTHSLFVTVELLYSLVIDPRYRHILTDLVITRALQL